DDGRRSDEICPGQTWTYTFEVTEETIGAWPFHDHYRNIGANVNRGLFGGLVILPEHEHERLPLFPFPPDFEKHVQDVLKQLEGKPRRPPKPQGAARARDAEAMKLTGMPMPGRMPRGGQPPMRGQGADLSETPAE